ncbi:MAG: metal ABC transporter ATP-binding protein [Myxococcales bacterium]|nr:metal ABC transporter ATP-binding protein [Myxococcales bacterium]MCB9580855.1 metal ABC transporter ATP-binding protein [Polyangiaceae bacterium]
MSDPGLRCKALEVGYLGKAILPKIDLEIRPGEFWAVIGRNGSGKTTWLRTLLGLLPPVAGAVVRTPPQLRFSYLPQRKAIDELYPLFARDVVRMGLERNWSFLRPRLNGEPPEVEQALAEMGVADLGDTPYRKLSEGQKQRVLFARLAVSHAQVAVLDEPTSAMDKVAEHEAFQLLDGLRQRQGLAIVIVSHFLGMVEQFADRALLLDRDTQSVVSGPPHEVFSHETFHRRFSERPPAIVEEGEHV